MIERKDTGRASPLLLVLLTLGFFFGTYNLLTVIINYSSSGKWVGGFSDNRLLTDPIVEMPRTVRRVKNSRSLFHVALTATDAPYNKWQCRIMYYWYKRQKDLPGSEMGGFTRVLHSGNPDNLMEEIPTVVVDPLPAGLDRVRLLFVSSLYLVAYFPSSLLFVSVCLYFSVTDCLIRCLKNMKRRKNKLSFFFFANEGKKKDLLIHLFLFSYL